MSVDRPRTAALHAVPHVHRTAVAHPAPVDRARFDSRSARPVYPAAAPVAAPAAALAASGGTIIYGAATGPRATAAPGHAIGPAPAAVPEPAAVDITSVIDITSAIELDSVDPAATTELRADVIAALIAEATKDMPAERAAGRAAAASRSPAARPAAASRPPAARPSAASRSPAANPSPAIIASAALTLPRGSAAELTAPGPTAAAVDPASLWWSERPPLARSSAQTLACSAPWRRRPPRVGVVVFFLIASLLCGILAPICGAVASSELAGIKLGVVANRHRRLLAVALGWGVVASCLMIAAFLYLLWVAARTGALGT